MPFHNKFEYSCPKCSFLSFYNLIRTPSRFYCWSWWWEIKLERQTWQELNAFSLKKAWRRQWHPTPVLLPGKSHGQRSLVGCSPWGRWGSDTTERLHFHFSLSCIGKGNGNPLQCSCLENPRDGGKLPSMGSHRVGHDWRDLAAAAADYLSKVDIWLNLWQLFFKPLACFLHSAARFSCFQKENCL